MWQKLKKLAHMGKYGVHYAQPLALAERELINYGTYYVRKDTF